MNRRKPVRGFLGSRGMSSQDIYRQLGVAIHEAQAGRKDTAREILLQILKQDPRNETAWGWMATVVETAAERQFCLKKVLEINPGNLGAREALDADEVSGGTPSSPFKDWTPAEPVRSRPPGRAAAPAPGPEAGQEPVSPDAAFGDDPEAALEWVLGGAITPAGPRASEPAYSGGYGRSREETETPADKESEVEEPPLFDSEELKTAEEKLDDILGPMPALRRLRSAVKSRSRLIRALEEDNDLPGSRWAFVRSTPGQAEATRPAASGVDEPPEEWFTLSPPEREPVPERAAPPPTQARAASPKLRRRVLWLIVGLILAALVVALVAAAGGRGSASPVTPAQAWTATPEPTPAAGTGSPTEGLAPAPAGAALGWARQRARFPFFHGK